MRLLKGSITVEEINNMPRRELLSRLEARVRALQNQDKKTKQASALQDRFDMS